MRICFIRHGKTAGNLSKRYIGKTDEPLCEECMDEIKNRTYPNADIIISSPLKRCMQTSSLIYPDKTPIIKNGLRECDFGDFEGKNYIELDGDAYYQKWINSRGVLPFPNGEDPSDFMKRCCEEFINTVNSINEDKTVSFIVHDGTVMSIMHHFCTSENTSSYFISDMELYYSYHVSNGCGYITEWNGTSLKIISKI